MKRLAAIAFLILTPLSAQAQSGWGNLDVLLGQSLSGGGAVDAALWLPDNLDPALATEALGILYVAVSGAASTTTLEVGLFRKGPNGFGFAGRVTGLFGLDPREQLFTPDAITLTTTILKPEDARCCPTGTGLWRIDRATLTATQLN